MEASATSSSLAAHVTPAGELIVAAEPSAEADGLDPAARAHLLSAMARGAGHAVLHLGLTHVDHALAPSLALLRDLGKRFATRLCAEPDLEEKRERAAPAASDDDIAALLEGVPPMLGAEYVTAEVLRSWWRGAATALGEELRVAGGSVQEWLRAYGSAWNVVGKVCFHLAENPADPELPFAFLATYATRTTGKGKVAHAPLSRALAESSQRGDNASLLSLLVPVQRAAEHSALVKELLDEGDLYHPLAWSPREAHRFLGEIPALEAAGISVRVPDWWRARRPPRPEVQVTVGGKAPGAGLLGADTMLDFSVEVTLEGEPLSAAELRDLLARGEGLALVPTRAAQGRARPAASAGRTRILARELAGRGRALCAFVARARRACLVAA